MIYILLVGLVLGIFLTIIVFIFMEKVRSYPRYSFPKGVDKCEHDFISFGDACYCPKCGYESTVWGAYFWSDEMKEIVKGRYKGELSSKQLEDEITKLGGDSKCLNKPKLIKYRTIKAILGL